MSSSESIAVATHPDYPAIDVNGKITKLSRITAFIFVLLLPSLAMILAGILVWKGMVTKVDLAIFGAMYVATGLGLTAGYHRLFTHRSFETYRPIRYALALLGCMNAEGAPIVWASQHRQHHASSDHAGDPHSPFVNRRSGFIGFLKSLWHSHYGHVFNQIEMIDPKKYAPDLEREPFLRGLEKWSALAVLAGFLIPGAAGWWITGSYQGALTGILWGGFVRLFVITHATGAINSLCHYFGYRTFDTGDESGNVWWLVPFSLGESWHQNHHAFPTSARHGLRWWECDPSWIFIWTLEKTGLARNVIRVSPERMQQKMIRNLNTVNS